MTRDIGSMTAHCFATPHTFCTHEANHVHVVVTSVRERATAQPSAMLDASVDGIDNASWRALASGKVKSKVPGPRLYRFAGTVVAPRPFPGSVNAEMVVDYDLGRGRRNGRARCTGAWYIL